MNKKYIVRLTDEERACAKGSSRTERDVGESASSGDLAQGGHGRAGLEGREDQRGRGLSSSDGGEPAARLRSGRLRGRAGAQETDDAAHAQMLDGEAEAKLIAMRLGKPPAGYGHWTLQLLADELVALEIVDSISPETVRKTLKKTA